MRILLTGSSGWLGRFLAPRLRDAGHIVTGLDVAPGPDTTVIGSVSDRDVVEKVFTDHSIDAVIHAGALHKPDIARYPAQAFVDVNVSGTLNLLRAATAAHHDRFIFTSTTSLMISDAVRRNEAKHAIWMDEEWGPIAPRNVYGVTKLAAEGLCRIQYREHGLNCIILRTGRFFPEDDDTDLSLSGPNQKANEFLGRRLTVEDAADAHLAALEAAPRIGFDTFILAAPIPIQREDARTLVQDAASVIQRYFPDAKELYTQRGWRLPQSIGRIYDSSRAAGILGFRCKTDFGSILDALRKGDELPFTHDAAYVSPHWK
jgi:UDP-glucose 4-epimerase